MKNINRIIGVLGHESERAKVLEFLFRVYPQLCDSKKPKQGHCFSAKTPLRLGLAGGGSDLPDVISAQGGHIVSATIDKHCTVSLTFNESSDVHLEDSIHNTRGVFQLQDINDFSFRYRYIHELFYIFNIQCGANISLSADIPLGTGLGASSSLIVNFIEVLSFACSVNLSKGEKAEVAYILERVLCNKLGGWQDQLASSFGGGNAFDFNKSEVRPLELETIKKLESSLVLISLGTTRDSGQQLKKVISRLNIKKYLEIQDQNASISLKLEKAIQRDDVELSLNLIRKSCELKEMISSLVGEKKEKLFLDFWKKQRGVSGKYLGGGFGGAYLFVVPKAQRTPFIESLERESLHPLSFHFTSECAKVSNEKF